MTSSNTTPHHVATGTLDYLAWKQKQEFEHRDRAIQRTLTPTFPKYPDQPDDPVDTQVAFFDKANVTAADETNNRPFYYKDGAWHPFAADASDLIVPPSIPLLVGAGLYEDVVLTGGVDNHVGGTPFDLTTDPTAPNQLRYTQTLLTTDAVMRWCVPFGRRGFRACATMLFQGTSSTNDQLCGSWLKFSLAGPLQALGTEADSIGRGSASWVEWGVYGLANHATGGVAIPASTLWSSIELDTNFTAPSPGVLKFPPNGASNHKLSFINASATPPNDGGIGYYWLKLEIMTQTEVDARSDLYTAAGFGSAQVRPLVISDLTLLVPGPF